MSVKTGPVLKDLKAFMAKNEELMISTYLYNILLNDDDREITFDEAKQIYFTILKKLLENEKLTSVGPIIQMEYKNFKNISKTPHHIHNSFSHTHVIDKVYINAKDDNFKFNVKDNEEWEAETEVMSLLIKHIYENNPGDNVTNAFDKQFESMIKSYNELVTDENKLNVKKLTKKSGGKSRKTKPVEEPTIDRPEETPTTGGQEENDLEEKDEEEDGDF